MSTHVGESFVYLLEEGMYAYLALCEEVDEERDNELRSFSPSRAIKKSLIDEFRKKVKGKHIARMHEFSISPHLYRRFMREAGSDKLLCRLSSDKIIALFVMVGIYSCREREELSGVQFGVLEQY